MFECFNTLTLIEQDPYVVFCYVNDFSKDCVSMDCRILSKWEGKKLLNGSEIIIGFNSCASTSPRNKLYKHFILNRGVKCYQNPQSMKSIRFLCGVNAFHFFQVIMLRLLDPCIFHLEFMDNV